MQDYFVNDAPAPVQLELLGLYSPMIVRDAVDRAISVHKDETVYAVKVIPVTVVERDSAAQFIDPYSTVYETKPHFGLGCNVLAENGGLWPTP